MGTARRGTTGSPLLTAVVCGEVLRSEHEYVDHNAPVDGLLHRGFNRVDIAETLGENEHFLVGLPKQSPCFALAGSADVDHVKTGPPSG